MHDDNIQTELQSITKGELEFNNRPFVKHRVDNRTEDYPSGGGKYRKNFGARNNNQGRDNRNNQGGRDNRNNNNQGRDNRNNKFKKRY